MKKFLVTKLSLLHFFILTTSAYAEAIQGDSIIKIVLHSKILNEERRIMMHLPRNYFNEINEVYPIMYVLDGPSQSLHTKEKITILADAGYISDAIVVSILNGKEDDSRNRDMTPPFMKSDIEKENSPFGGGDKFLAFIEKELIPHIDSNYRAADYRALSGNSRGGLFVMYTLLERPSLFQARFCYSPAFWREENIIVSKISTFLEKSSTDLGFLYMSIGNNEVTKMMDAYNSMLNELNMHSRKRLLWKADYTSFAVHQDNAIISASKGLAEWGKYLELQKANHKK